MDQKYIEETAYKRRINIIALSILKRAKDAEIPEKHMRINKEEFSKLLCEEYHGGEEGIQKLSSYCFDTANKLFNYSYVVIDGGTEYGRMRAGFALLFRMIACDKTGKYENCKRLIHTLSTFNGREDINRNDYVDDMIEYDSLFLGEFDKKDVNIYLEAGSFMDEIYEARENKNKPTIISFQKPLDSKNTPVKNNIISVTDCGIKMSILSRCEINKMPEILRIRVKI